MTSQGFMGGNPIGGPATSLDGLPYVEFFDDFVGSNVSATAELGTWLHTVVNSSTTTVADDYPGGAIVLTTGGTDTNEHNLQLNGEMFKLVADKPLYFEAKFQVDDVSLAGCFVGLAVADAAILDGCDDLVGVMMEDGSASTDLKFISELSGTRSTATQDLTAGTMADATDITVAMAWDGRDSIKCIANGAEIGTITDAICNDQALTPSIEVMARSGAARTLTIDYILVRQYR